jgi:hypothetical protein
LQLVFSRGCCAAGRCSTCCCDLRRCPRVYFCRPGLFGVDHSTSEVVGNSHFEPPLRPLGVSYSLPLPAGWRPRLHGLETRERASRIYIPAAVEEGAKQLYSLVISKPTDHRQVVYSSMLFRTLPVPVNNETVPVKVLTNNKRNWLQKSQKTLHDVVSRLVHLPLNPPVDDAVLP